jgi:tetratricopeptide (TPR) repeat protein
LADSKIIGRDHEVGRLTSAIEDAADGRGSVWYLTGEPGIGKSRLAEEVARLARVRGMRTFWGRCWEAGGAPAYWPWVQVLRAVHRTAPPGQLEPHMDTLSQLLPELRSPGSAGEPSDLEPDQARFRLMDAVSNVLAEAAQQLPLVVVLEDLHVADVSTVLLLEFLTSTVRHQSLLIVGTFREAELASTPAGVQLTHAAQQGQRLALGRLSEDDVVVFLEASGETADREFVKALYRTTDGHPLFLVEVGRLWRAQGREASHGTHAIPRSVRTAIRERLLTVSPECVETLQCGAIVGREFDIRLLESCQGKDRYLQSAREAAEASILVEVAPQRYRFVHFLIRELVYEGIAEDERAAAHAQLARALEAHAREGEPRWSEIAHHLIAAGQFSEAVRAYRHAGSQALRQLAFDEALSAYESARRAADRSGELRRSDRIELLLELAHARTRAGEIATGKEACMAAAALARDLGDAELLARAALEHGTALQYATIDHELIGLLEEALLALGPADSDLRARVMARLAAATQPAEDPEGPMELAREAIAMARRLDDPCTLLDTLRNGGSAMVDLGDLNERLALDRELAALAEELGNPVEALRGNLRAIMDYLALERLDDAFRVLRACERITQELDHPAYSWRPIAMTALRALWEGRLDEAEHLIDKAHDLGLQGADRNAEAVYVAQRVRLLQFRGKFEAQLPLLATLADLWPESDIGPITALTVIGAEHAHAGRIELARRCFDAPALNKLLRLEDHSTQLAIAKLCATAGDRELAERLHHRMMLSREHMVTGGILLMVLEGPTTWGLAWVTRLLGLRDEAREHFERALEVARRTGGRPVNALIALEYAHHLLEEDGAESRERARELAEVAKQIAEDVEMPAVRAEADQLLETLPSVTSLRRGVAPEPRSLSMLKAGDSWLVSYDNVEFHLKDVRGVQMLATLLREPGREFHVLDLSAGAATGGEPVDRGDSGQAIDDEARRQYRARVLELREELREAESWNDLARAERVRTELEAIQRELSQALGLGGRERRIGAAAERARVNVQRRIRDAIRRIESYHPGLAKHLNRAVRTGAYCSYDP